MEEPSGAYGRLQQCKNEAFPTRFGGRRLTRLSAASSIVGIQKSLDSTSLDLIWTTRQAGNGVCDKSRASAFILLLSSMYALSTRRWLPAALRLRRFSDVTATPTNKEQIIYNKLTERSGTQKSTLSPYKPNR
jgi:hypothetical protein